MLHDMESKYMSWYEGMWCWFEIVISDRGLEDVVYDFAAEML